jgi:multidrug transporter EmrE-like cation transporter
VKKFKENLLAIGWSIKLALSINAGIFVFWGSLSVLVALLPAAALYYNRKTVSILSAFVFHERLTLMREVGVALILAGVWFISSTPQATSPESLPMAVREGRK